MTWFDIVKSDSKKEILEGLSVLQQNIKPNMLKGGGGITVSISDKERKEYNLVLDKNFDDFYFGYLRFDTSDTELNSSEIKDRVVSFIKELNAGDLHIDRYTTAKWTSTSKDRIAFKKSKINSKGHFTIDTLIIEIEKRK